jgi:hypothetical protein
MIKKNIILMFFFIGLYILGTKEYAQTKCDNCPKPIIDIYGVRMNVGMPTDSTGKVTNLLDPAFLNWISLGDAQVAMAQIKDNDPEKDCVDWLDGTMAQEFLANPDTEIKANLENWSTGDLPANGPVPGIDFLIWASLDSSGGQFHFHVYLEEAHTRARLAEGEADFTDPNKSQDAANTAISQIEPIFNKVRTYQKNVRNLGGNDVAITAKVNVIPSKIDLKGGETIPVVVEVNDCDGTPLSSRWVKISATYGHFDKDSVETDGSGKSTANFTADNVQEMGNLTGIYFPYFTPSDKRKGAWGDTTVNINYVPTNSWVINYKANHFSTDESHYQDNITCSYSNSFSTSHAEVTQYVVGTFRDSSISIDHIVGGKGSTSGYGFESGYSNSSTLYSKGSITEVYETDPTEDFMYSIDLDDYLQYDKYNGIGFTSALLLFHTRNWYQFMAGSAVVPSPYEHDTTYTYDQDPDNYLFYTVGPNDIDGGNNATWTKTDSGFVFKGDFSHDTTITDANSEEKKHFEEHVVATVTPYSKLTSVNSPVVNTIPQEYKLLQNYPNPFNPSTIISYSIPKSSFVSLKIFNTLGQEVESLVNKEQQPGNYKVKLVGSRLSSGVYFYRIVAGNFVQTKKLILLK